MAIRLLWKQVQDSSVVVLVGEEKEEEKYMEQQ